jgi:SAM-dependent methyltransferase
VTYQWADCERAFIAARYDRIAGLIGFIDWLFFVPPHFRKRAAQRLGLRPGDRVLEIGCGTGRNFPYLRQAVGPNGRIYGVDLSGGMLAKAQALCEQQQWSNVELAQNDAAEYVAPEPLDGVLFGLSLRGRRPMAIHGDGSAVRRGVGSAINKPIDVLSRFKSAKSVGLASTQRGSNRDRKGTC